MDAPEGLGAQGAVRSHPYPHLLGRDITPLKAGQPIGALFGDDAIGVANGVGYDKENVDIGQNQRQHLTQRAAMTHQQSVGIGVAVGLGEGLDKRHKPPLDIPTAFP